MKDKKHQEAHPIEALDYEIEENYAPNGPPCGVCNEPTEIDALGKSFCPSCIAQYYDRYAKQDTMLSMRMSASLLEDVKATAKHQGKRHYQEFIREILMKAVQKNRKKVG